MAFDRNFHENKAGIIGFFKAYNGMQHDRSMEVQFDEKGQDLYDLLGLADSEDALGLERKCRALVKVMTPCFSGGSTDPFARVDQVDASEDAPLSADHIADWVPEREKSDAHFSESVSVGSDPEESTEREDLFLRKVRAAHAFILDYLNRLSEGGFNPDLGGTYTPYDPNIAKQIAQRDAPPPQRLVFYYANFEDHSDYEGDPEASDSEGTRTTMSGEDNLAPSAVPAPLPRIDPNDPVQQAIRAAEEFEKFKSSWTVAGWELALTTEDKKESRKAWTNNASSLSILPTGFGAGALIGFGVVKLGVAAIGIAGISFPPILLIGAVVAVTAAIAYCCIKKYKKSPTFTKKQRPKIPPENAMLFAAPAVTAPGRAHYNRFRAFFESMHKKFSQPITDKTTASWKKIQACLDRENTPECDMAWLTNLKNNLKEWKEEEAADGADRDQVFSKYFGRIMSGASRFLQGLDRRVLSEEARQLEFVPRYYIQRYQPYLKICSTLKQELFGSCTKDMLSFYADFKENNWDMTGLVQRRLRALKPYAAENPLPQPGGA